MRFGLQIGGGSYQEVLEWARWAESRALSGFAIPDHYLRSAESASAYDALAVVAGLARETEQIELVLLVSPVTWRHPAVLAKTYATVAEMSGDRFTLGVGTGWMEKEHRLFGLPFPELGTRFDMLEEALAYLRSAYSEPPRSFTGEHYRFEAFDMQPRPSLRLLVGGTGANRTPMLAGRFADEFNGYPAPAEEYAAKVDLARAAAAEAGRDPDGLLVSSSGVVIGGDDEEEWRGRLDSVAVALGREPEEVLDGLQRRNAPVGTWEEVGETLAGLAAAGMSRFWIQSIARFGETPDYLEKALERLGSL